jgi:hypothetical protein
MNVDVIGKEGVTKLITASKLTKFMIVRQGARSGSTPVFDGSHCNTLQQVVSSFQSWAENLLAANPGNNNPYEILLYSKTSDIEDDLEDDPESPARKPKAGKMKKVRFSFCLAGYHGYGNNASHVNVDEAIKRALAERDQQDALKALHAKIDSLEAQLNGDDEEEEEEKESTFWKAVELIQSGKGKKESLQVAGDEAGPKAKMKSSASVTL